MNGSAGFTLIELVVILAIVGVVLAVTLPGIGGYQDSTKLKAAAERLVSLIEHCRETAISRQTTVVFVRESDRQCSYFIDDNGNFQYDQQEDMFTPSEFPEGVVIDCSALSPADSLFFDSSGLLTGASSGGVITIIAAGGRSEEVEVWLSGRAAVR